MIDTALLITSFPTSRSMQYNDFTLLFKCISCMCFSHSKLYMNTSHSICNHLRIMAYNIYLLKRVSLKRHKQSRFTLEKGVGHNSFKDIIGPDRNCNFISTGSTLISSKGYLGLFRSEELFSSNASVSSPDAPHACCVDTTYTYRSFACLFFGSQCL